MHTIVHPRYTLVERAIVGLFTLITWPLEWIVGRARETLRELDREEEDI